MALWLGNPTSQRSFWNIEPFTNFGFNDILSDFDHEFRRLNRELTRLERDYLRSGGVLGNQLASLVDRNVPILPNIIVDANGQRQAQLRFDISGFQPDDITIKTEDGKRLIVSGIRDEKGEDYHHHREFKRMITIPEGTNLEQMQSQLSPQGVLTIQAPYNPPAAVQDAPSQDKVMPIKHERIEQQKA